MRSLATLGSTIQTIHNYLVNFDFSCMESDNCTHFTELQNPNILWILEILKYLFFNLAIILKIIFGYNCLHDIRNIEYSFLFYFVLDLIPFFEKLASCDSVYSILKQSNVNSLQSSLNHSINSNQNYQQQTIIYSQQKNYDEHQKVRFRDKQKDNYPINS